MPSLSTRLSRATTCESISLLLNERLAVTGPENSTSCRIKVSKLTSWFTLSLKCHPQNLSSRQNSLRAETISVRALHDSQYSIDAQSASGLWHDIHSQRHRYCAAVG